LKATLPATIEIRQSIQPDLKPVLADPTQIHQVLMNLCTNAGHAMKERGGILSVVLDTPAADESAYEENGNTVRDNYVRFTITDTGCGISGHVMARIFEPYFTTKSPGEGTGLGLSVVHGIVKSCGGVISVTSEIGVGTRFEVRIPTIETAPSEDDVDEESTPGGWERVLFVDDEPGVTDMGKRILESLGYTVSVRTSSLEALELFRTAPYAFDLVITDMTMPHMTGADLTREMKIIRPDIRVIVCTGYSDLLGDELIQRLGIHSVVMKPASKNTLAAVVRRALDETSERK
jgi:CheY-like chemotaxis protein